MGIPKDSTIDDMLEEVREDFEESLPDDPCLEDSDLEEPFSLPDLEARGYVFRDRYVTGKDITLVYDTLEEASGGKFKVKRAWVKPTERGGDRFVIQNEEYIDVIAQDQARNFYRSDDNAV